MLYTIGHQIYVLYLTNAVMLDYVLLQHGGAWGSGIPWMYRLTATPFLEKNMVVAVVGYRTYPDGNLNDQINDLEDAFQAFKMTFPQYLKPPAGMKKKDWLGMNLIGHSSGAHISMLMLIRRLEQKLENRSGLNQVLDFDAFVSLAGVFSIYDHFLLEVERGIEEFSPMKPICGYTREMFGFYSPTDRMLHMKNSSESTFSTRMLFIHGTNDPVVPFTSTQKLVSAIKQVGRTDCSEYYLPNVDHVETVTDVMFGGQSRNIVQQWLEEK